MAYCKNCGSEAGPKRNQHVKLRKYTCRRNPGSSYSEGYDFAALIPDVTDYSSYDSGSYDSGYSGDDGSSSSYTSDSGGYSSDSSSSSSSYDSGSYSSGE
jgi:hypothetical protein